MTKIVPYADITVARQRAEQQFDRLHALEHVYELLPLARRLHEHRRLLDRHNLVLAFETHAKYPAIYIIKRNHSEWCRIWRCGSDGGFRLDATRKSSNCSYYDVMSVDLCANVDIACRCLVGMLERDEIRYGNWYLPAKLRDISDITLPLMSPPPVAALPAPQPTPRPPPTIDAVAVEVRPATPLALRPVALARKPMSRR